MTCEPPWTEIFWPIGTADFLLVRGTNDPPLAWQFLTSENPDVPFTLDGSIFKLTVVWPDNPPLVVSSDIDTALSIDAGAGIVAWAYTTAQSRALPLGRLTRYELERWIDGAQTTFIRGFLSVTTGYNPD